MSFADDIMTLRYSWTKEDGTKETWEEIAERVVNNVFGTSAVQKIHNLSDIMSELIRIISERKFIPGGRFLAQSGREYHQTNNCFLLRATDTREGWGELAEKATRMLMSGGGIGIDYSLLREKNAILKRSGGVSSGPIPLMKVINEIGRGVMSGGSRRSAIWAGLSWNHPDIMDFIELKNWPDNIKKLKEKDFDFPAAMDMTNISVILDKDFFDAYENPDNEKHKLAKSVYWKTVESMCKTGEPGFSVNYDNKNESLRNACCEVVSEDDSDVCCLGSINLARIKDLEELEYVTDLGQLFLIAGIIYSDVPHSKVREVKLRNMRTGLGLMGLHEWLIRNSYKYEENEELAEWMQTWKDVSDRSAKNWSNALGVNEPIKKRALAPNGTISIAGGQTTSGIEPIFSLAYQRRYHTDDGWKKQYVVDFVAERLHNEGYDLSNVEDAYYLALNVEKRIKFQSFIQSYVDNSISSTVNLPEWGTLGNNDYKKFGKMLMKYLKNLRGITVYPNGARNGQPLTPVDFNYAIERRGVVFEGHEECTDGVCGL